MPDTAWKGHLWFDVLCIQIKICAAAREKDLPFHLVYGIDPPAAARAATASAASGLGKTVPFPGTDPVEPPIPDHVAPVHRAWVRADGVPLPDALIFKAYELMGRFVTFTPAELERLGAPKAVILPITACVDEKEIDLKYYNLSYDVWPDRGGEALYEAFYLGLRDKRLAGIAQVPLFGKERWVAVRAGRHGLVLHTLYYTDEVRLEDEYHVELGRSSRNDRQLVRELMQANRAKFDGGKLTNKYHQRVAQSVADRWEKSCAKDGSDDSPQRPLILEMGEALRRSLEINRKPPQRERSGRAPQKGKNRRGGRP